MRKGDSSKSRALTKAGGISGVGRLVRFSTPSGRPVTAEEKGMVRMLRLGPEQRLVALNGVVTMVARTPRLAKRRAMSTMGSMWPGVSIGRKKMWSSMDFSQLSLVADEAEEEMKMKKKKKEIQQWRCV